MLARWDPWQELWETQRQFADLTRRLLGGRVGEGEGIIVPAVDVLTRGEDLVVRAELPGIDPERDVSVEVDDGALRIHGQRRQERREEGDQFVRIESSYGAFERRIPLPDGVREEDIKASYDNGILEVVVPKAGTLTGGRKIPIQVGKSKKELAA